MYKVYSAYGIGIAIVLIAYFLILKLAGLHQYPVLSIFNGIIFAVGIYMALSKYRKSVDEVQYEKGFQVGLFTGGVAAILFTIFMAVYMYQLDSEFSHNIMQGWDIESDLGTFMLLVTILIMGIVTSLILTFSYMQLFKKSWNSKEGNRHTFS